MIHAAKIENSKRLQKTLEILQQRGRRGASTAEIQEITGSMAVGTDVSELRKNGFYVRCFYTGESPEGRKIYVYVLNSGGLPQMPSGSELSPSAPVVAGPIPDGELFRTRPTGVDPERVEYS